MPKFNKKENELESIIDQWVYFIKNAENLEIIPENIKDEGLKCAYQDADKHNWTKAELEAYDYVLMREQDERGRWALATWRAIEQARKEGIRAAEEKAIIEAHIQKEGIALKLFVLGMQNSEIMIATGLTFEEVERLRSEK